MIVYRLFTTLKLSVAALLLGALNLSPAHAVDGKLYPGSMCVRWAGTTAPAYSYSDIGNPSSSTSLSLDCPAVRDAATISGGAAYVVDLSYSDNISCNLVSSSRYSLAASPTRTTTGSGTTPQVLSFGGLGADSASHYYFSCRIPPTYLGNTSWISTYKVVEND